MPADIMGTQVIGGRGGFEFLPGPVFANLLLADEINRATPRTQSALLEAMQERTVTVAGRSRPLPAPFFVLATESAAEGEGLYALPEAQLDGSSCSCASACPIRPRCARSRRGRGVT